MDKNLLTFNFGHHANVAIFHNYKLVKVVEEERLTNVKYDNSPFLAIENIVKEYPIHAVAVTATQPVFLEKFNAFYLHPANNVDVDQTYEFIGETKSILTYLKKLNRKYHQFNENIVLVGLGLHHHDTHISSGFYGSGFNSALGIVIDGLGSFVLGNSYSGGGPECNGCETLTVYDCSAKEIKPLYKELISNNKLSDETLSFRKTISSLHGLYDVELKNSYSMNIGMAYEKVCQYLGFTLNDAGKIMGLAPYGNFQALNFDLIVDERLSDNLVCLKVTSHPDAGERIEKIIALPEDLRIQDIDDHTVWHHDKSKINDLAKNLAASIQYEYENKLYNTIKTYLNKTGHKNVVLSGGCGLNVVANYKVLKRLRSEEYPDLNMFVDPLSHDAGTSLGAGYFLNVFNQNTKPKDHKLNTLYLGNSYDIDINKLISKFNKKIGIKTIDASGVANLLSENKLVAMYQGRAEAGPRALGNRSILFNPANINGKEIVNKVKKREWFRPFAATILKEHSEEWFDMCGMEESPFMMFAVDVLESKKEKIPCVVHVDGTCRIQTVSKDQNYNFYNLIEKFQEITGIPLLLNTSFNLAGETMVETPEDAIRTLINSDLDFVYFPEISKLVYKNES